MLCLRVFQLTDDVKKEKEKEPEKAEKQETSMLRKKGFEEEKKDSDDSDEVRTPLTEHSALCRLDLLSSGPLFSLSSQ